jgi:hypothetical protein
VAVNADNLAEASESFALQLSNPSIGTLTTATGTATVQDSPVALSIADVCLTEPASGTARTLPRMHALRRAVDEIAVALLDHDIRAEQLPIQSCGQRRARRAAGLVG